MRVTSAALAILGRADSLIPDDSMMEKYRKLIKRQRPEKTEESADSRARMPSLDQAAQPIKSPEAPVEEQASDETAAVPSSPKRWEALNVSPSNSSTYSQWQQELREIEREQASDVWESCPYD
ncbi:hypothetical protein [Chroococcidiopsis cubana]|uniref:hypothetical protein n=1 Tax=Chroococcidiopsis cubana TaxID=171392 RepID=UPI002ACEBD34|nr:hypothetical protein [Chroococcidiopsis cubana]